MAKVPFSKLNLKKIDKVQVVTINGLEVEVKQYLPVAEKLELIANVLNNSADDNNFANPVKTYVLSHLEIIYAYTNLSFTDKQKEDPAKLYDILETNGIIDSIILAMPPSEYDNLIEDITSTIDAYYKYKNSALGILEAATTDYKNLDLEASDIQKKIADPDNLTLLKDVITRLG